MPPDFESRLSRIVGDGMLSLAIGIGNRLRLFDELEKASKESGVDSAGLAASLGLKERYVREWLGAVVTGDIVELAEGEGKYYLSEERAKSLSFKYGETYALYSWSVLMFAGVSEDLVRAFQKDGPRGIPYSRYPLFHEWRLHIANSSFKSFVDDFLTASDVALWSKASTPPGLDVCELGCSHGVLSRLLAEKFPESRFWASDIGSEQIEAANEKKMEANLPNLTYQVQNAENLPSEWTGKFDAVVVYDVVHDIPRPDVAAKELYRVLKTDGVLFAAEIDLHTGVEKNLGNPAAPVVYVSSLFHCMPVCLSSAPEAWGLGLAWGRQRASKIFQGAGFNEPEIVDASHRKFPKCLYICRK